MSRASDLAKIREVLAQTTAGNGATWHVGHAATEDGLSRVDDGLQSGMFPIYGEAHDVELAALCVNFVARHVLGVRDDG
jgi:hypothetical protein